MNQIAINILTHTVSAFLAFLLIFIFLMLMRNAQAKAASGGCGCGGSSPKPVTEVALNVYDPSSLFQIH